MFSIPLDATSLRKSFLDGNGSLEAIAEPRALSAVLASGQPFPPGAGELVHMKFGAGTNRPLKLGIAGALELAVESATGVASVVDLVWPGEASEAVDAYGLRPALIDGKLYVHLHFEATATATVDASYPAGPLSATFGVTSGGSVACDRLVLTDATSPARLVLEELFAGFRLPHSAAGGDVPAQGEVLALRHGGYLKLSAGLTWGYSLSISDSIEIADLGLALDLGLKTVAAARLGYRIAGEFDIVARRGTRGSDWVRFQVRKSRESQLNFAADFGFTGQADLGGMPESADAFLATLLGTDPGTILDHLARAREFASVDELEAKLGAVAKHFLGELSQKWLGSALEDGTIQDFCAVAGQVVEAYRNIDSRITDVFEEYLDRQSDLESALERLSGLSDASGVAGLPADAIDLVRRVWGGRFAGLVFGSEPLAELKEFVARFRGFLSSAASAKVRDLISTVTQRLGLEATVAEIAEIDTPEKIRALVDGRLRELIGKLIGQAFSDLRTDRDFVGALAKLQSSLDQIEAFRQTWKENVTKLVQQKFALDLHYAYARATTTATLVDVEVSVATAAGRALAAAAARGDFSAVLESLDTGLVAINEASLTHRLTRSAEIRINMFGRGLRSFVEVVQNVKDAIESGAGGLMHVYTLGTSIKRQEERSFHGRRNESLDTNFLLGTVASALLRNRRPGEAEPVIESLESMAVDYDLSVHDSVTTADELTEILAFAKDLGLVENVAAVVAELGREFPDGLGTVNANYMVRLDDRAVRNAFMLSGPELEGFVRATVRRLVAAKYTSMSRTDARSVVGFAYLEPVFFELFKEGFTVLQNTRQPFFIPEWFTGGPARKVSLNPQQRELLLTLFKVERSVVERFAALDRLVDAASAGESIRLADLSEASWDFVAIADNLDRFGRVNTFFAVFDRLAREGGSGKGRRESVLRLEITPPHGAPVTKYLMG